MNKQNIPHYIKPIFFILFITLLGGCSKKDIGELDLTTKSETYLSVAKSLQQACNKPAEFGRCGECRVDGFRTTCAFALRCLENGFCVKAKQ